MVNAAAGTSPLRGLDYYQVVQPFELDDELVLPDGRRFTGARARVYWLLRVTQDRAYAHAVGRHQGPPGWTPRHLLVEPWSGGAEGHRRVRELREYGMELEIDAFRPPDGEGSATMLYRLRVDPCRSAGTPLPANRPPTPKPSPLQAMRGEVGSVLAVVERATPRAGLAFWLAPAGEVGGPNPLDLAPRRDARSPLVPDPCFCSAAEYRDELKRLWADGQLQDLLERPQEITLCCAARGLRYDPVEVLSRVLEACGATPLGLWRTATAGEA